LLAGIHPDDPDFEESRWIISEDVNAERLLDVFAFINVNPEDIWDACTKFMVHLYWHNPRFIILGSEIEVLPDDRPSEVQCLRILS
jgi:hypothetical protein